MKTCCKDFKELIKHIDNYPSLVFKLNIDDDGNISFDLSFYYGNTYSGSWRYLIFCPFCGIKLERRLY